MSAMTMTEAIAREKQIKRVIAQKEIALVASFNPEWRDLYETIAL